MGEEVFTRFSSQGKERCDKVRKLEVAIAEAGENHEQGPDHGTARGSSRARGAPGRQVAF